MLCHREAALLRRRIRGGGHVHEGEDMEMLELALPDALAQITTGAIRYGKTIMLLQHAALVGLKILGQVTT